jgi:Arc/MetJ-type ribon-helix-helix transcriptional regulator
MTIRLKPETERLVQEELQKGYFHSVDEIIVQGVQSRREAKLMSQNRRHKTAREAIAHIREIRQGVSLGSAKIKDLMNEGRP